MLLDLYHAWVGIEQDIRRWSCPPGYLAASQGYWREHALTDELTLYDDDDNHVAAMWDCKVSWVGYPLGDLEGDSGEFLTLRRGGVLDHFSVWTMLIV